jgi:hypothetical protein
VQFTTYPLGASSQAYLFNRLLGPSESASLLGHDLWLVSCAIPLVAATGRRWVPGVLLAVVGALALLTHVTRPISLLVDTLVAGLAACLLVLVLLQRRAVLRQPWPLAVLGAALITVKSSGSFFVAVVTVMALVVLWRQRARLGRALVAVWAATVVTPWVVWWLWGQHVARTFPDAGQAKHSVSVERFDRVLGEKTGEDVRAILGSLALTTLQNWTTVVLLLAVVLAGSLAVRAGAVTVADNRRTTLTMASVTGLWILSLALMYLFSMPTGEALNLAGYRRYIGTMHLVLVLVTLHLVSAWAGGVARPRDRRDVPQLVVAALALALPVSIALPSAGELVAGRREGQERRQLERELGAVGAGEDDRLCLLRDEPDGGYRGWMVRYLTLSPDVRTSVLRPDADSISRAQDCDVLVLDDPRENTLALAREAGFDVGDEPDLPVAVRR